MTRGVAGSVGSGGFSSTDMAGIGSYGWIKWVELLSLSVVSQIISNLLLFLWPFSQTRSELDTSFSLKRLKENQKIKGKPF